MVSGTPIANEVVEDAGLSSDSTSVMRLQATDGFYIYNLSTAGWNSTSGTRFRVTLKVSKAGHVDTLCDVYLINK